MFSVIFCNKIRGPGPGVTLLYVSIAFLIVIMYSKEPHALLAMPLESGSLLTMALGNINWIGTCHTFNQLHSNFNKAITVRGEKW
jgi:hypothetical protein